MATHYPPEFHSRIGIWYCHHCGYLGHFRFASVAKIEEAAFDPVTIVDPGSFDVQWMLSHTSAPLPWKPNDLDYNFANPTLTQTHENAIDDFVLRHRTVGGWLLKITRARFEHLARHLDRFRGRCQDRGDPHARYPRNQLGISWVQSHGMVQGHLHASRRFHSETA